MRKYAVTRNTNETKICLDLDLDGNGVATIDTGNGFFDHMMTLLTAHAKIDLAVKCDGDIDVDFHHSCEDIGIALGQAFKIALGDKRGISRYACITLPMDEALILCSVDISGRGCLAYDVKLPALTVALENDIKCVKCGEFDTELVEEFLLAFVRNADITLHVKMLDGKNTHHIIEGVFKALGRVIRRAVAIDSDYANVIPSTKGSL